MFSKFKPTWMVDAIYKITPNNNKSWRLLLSENENPQLPQTLLEKKRLSAPLSLRKSKVIPNAYVNTGQCHSQTNKKWHVKCNLRCQCTVVALASASTWLYCVVRRLLLFLRQMKRRPLSVLLLRDRACLLWILLPCIVKFQPSGERGRFNR